MPKSDVKAGDPITLLLTQLQYDRADVAQVSVEAAAILDLVIRLVEDAASGPDHESNDFDNLDDT